MKTDTRRIPLTQGKFAIVDAVDYEWLMQWKWFAKRQGNASNHCWYAARMRNEREQNEREQNEREQNRRQILMHREIAKRAGFPNDQYYDHIDHNGLNNKRSNIRPCTIGENAMNKRKAMSKTSNYKGVSWYKKYGKWSAIITAEGRRFFLGYFAEEDEAAKAYKVAACQHHRKFAFPDHR